MARNFPRRAQTRVMSWFQIIPATTATAVAAGTGILLASLNATALAARPFTVVRTRGLLLWQTDQAANTEDPFGVFSMQVVTESAVAAGIGSIPTPATETDADYFVFEPVADSLIVSSAIGIFNPHAQAIHRFDSKAMRKVGVWENYVP